MSVVPFRDLVAAVVTLGLLAAIVALPIIGREPSPYLVNCFTLAVGWTFRAGAQAANELTHRKRSPDP
jgi:hypothetical protein